MIQGTFLKDGETTEVVIGAEEVKRELQVFTFPKKEKTTHKRYEELTFGNAVALGIAIGGTLGGLYLGSLYMTGATKLVIWAVMVFDAIILLENLLKQRE